MKKTTALLILVLLIGLVSCKNPPDAENTGRNPATPTAGDQSETANIRKAVVADDSLSLNAHNIKIITANGMVTLRGPVKSEQERTAIEAKVKQVAGVKGVNNSIEIEVNR